MDDRDFAAFMDEPDSDEEPPLVKKPVAHSAKPTSEAPPRALTASAPAPAAAAAAASTLAAAHPAPAAAAPHESKSSSSAPNSHSESPSSAEATREPSSSTSSAAKLDAPAAETPSVTPDAAPLKEVPTNQLASAKSAERAERRQQIELRRKELARQRAQLSISTAAAASAPSAAEPAQRPLRGEASDADDDEGDGTRGGPKYAVDAPVEVLQAGGQWVLARVVDYEYGRATYGVELPDGKRTFLLPEERLRIPAMFLQGRPATGDKGS